MALKRRSLIRAELRAAGRQAYYDGVPMDAAPHRLADRLRWQEGWRAARLEVEEFVERARRNALKSGRIAGR